MAEYIEKEAVLAEIENDYKDWERIKTPFLQMIVEDSAEKPYYSILWWDVANKEFCIGYSSYCLDYVFKWREVVFEVIDADVVPVVRCKDCKYCEIIFPEKEIGKEPRQVLICKVFKCGCKPDGFCSYGERRADNG